MMRTTAGMTAVLAALFAAGCVSGSVEKKEAKVRLDERPPKPAAERLKVAVAEFADKSGYGGGRIGGSAADQLTNYLVNSKQFRVFERQQVAKVLDEQKLGQSGVVDPSTAAQVGKVMGVEYVIIGTVVNFGIRAERTDLILGGEKRQIAECKVMLRAVNTTTGEVVYAGEGDGEARRSAGKFLGVGGASSYDETLAGNSLNAAIVKLVDDLIDEIEMDAAQGQ